MKNILMLIMGIVPLYVVAQDIDTAKYAVWYDVTYKNKTEGDPLFKDREVLEIGNCFSFYYSYQRKLHENFMDSMERANPNVKDKTGFYLNEHCPKDGNTYMILKNLQNDSLIFMEKINQGQWFRYTENFPINNWVLEEGDTTIVSMLCYKASLNLHGRHWTVWYTNEIPIADGPWKLRGLPGLIMKATESDGIFSFTCVGINETKKLIQIAPQNFVDITPKRYQGEVEDYWHNQMEYICRVNNIPHSPDLWKNEKSYTPCLIEFY